MNVRGEFIIHVKGEYDYRFLSVELRDTISDTVKLMVELMGNKIDFYKVVN